MKDIIIDHLSKNYGEVQALDDVSFRFKKGQISCLMGESGSGKTTLLRIMMGLESASQGEISGVDPMSIGAVFQDDHLCLNLSAAANVLLTAAEKVSKTMVMEHFKRVALTEVNNRPVRELSGGMKRRVAIVRAMLSPAEVIFMDEPFKGLDEKIKNLSINYVKETAAGRTVIMVTHSRMEAEQIGGEIHQLI